MRMSLTMDLGEVRHIKIKVKSAKQEEFLIDDAYFDLKNAIVLNPKIQEKQTL